MKTGEVQHIEVVLWRQEEATEEVRAGDEVEEERPRAASWLNPSARVQRGGLEGGQLAGVWSRDRLGAGHTSS